MNLIYTRKLLLISFYGEVTLIEKIKIEKKNLLHHDEVRVVQGQVRRQGAEEQARELEIEKQGIKDKATAGGLSPDDFARKARRAISRQKREVVIGGPLEVIAVYVKRFFPGIHARMIRKAAVT